MSITTITNGISLGLMAVMMVACGPENNSRYGDEYWDPSETKEKFDPVKLPGFEVVYFDQDSDEAIEDWEARISIDFTDLARRSKDGLIVAQYQRGIASPKVIDALITSQDSDQADTRFWNDIEAGEDKRLTSDIPGNYKLIFDFDVIAPNGNTVSFLLDDIEFTVPGCQTNHVYYNDYINPILADHCVTCHSSGSARSALNLDSNNLTTRRDNFLNRLDSGLEREFNGTVLAWIFNNAHAGKSNAEAMTNTERGIFNAYVSLHQSDENRAAGDDFEFTSADGPNFCFAKPSPMVVEN
ncbi:MAG: hypothetical protein P8X74_10555 [Reinekea sp.]